MIDIDQIRERHENSPRLLAADADGDSPASVYEEEDGLDTICTIPGYYGTEYQNAMAEALVQTWRDRGALLAVIADLQAKAAEADYCPYDCDSCHDVDCPCDRMGCAGDKGGED